MTSIDPAIEPFFPKTYAALVALEATVDRLILSRAPDVQQPDAPTRPQVHTPTDPQVNTYPLSSNDQPPSLTGA